MGRKGRDLGMVVDLIFLNNEVSLTQALEDVGRARTPFAIIITQQHQVHRSCTVNILFGTPQGRTGNNWVVWTVGGKVYIWIVFCKMLSNGHLIQVIQH